MNIAIFAARNTQLNYANELSSYLKSNHNIDLLILWHKHLILNLGALFYNPSPAANDLNQIIDTFYKTKQNEPLNINKKYSIGSFRFIKRIHALILYKIYSYSFHKSKVTHLLIWNGLKFRQQIAVLAAKKSKIKCLYIERGVFPNTTTLDKNGINYINSVPRDVAFYENYNSDTQPPRLNENSARPSNLPEKYIFIPFQVNTDSQVVLFSPWIKNMFDLIDIVRNAVHEESDIPTIVFKQHPSCPQDYSEVIKEIESTTNKIKFINNIPASTLITHSCAVATINSSIGMEALLRGKNLIVMGQAFYSIEKICLQATSISSLTDAFNIIERWAPEKKLAENFLKYLKNEYVIYGYWKNSEEKHLLKMSEKIIKYTDE